MCEIAFSIVDSSMRQQWTVKQNKLHLSQSTKPNQTELKYADLLNDCVHGQWNLINQSVDWRAKIKLNPSSIFLSAIDL